MSCPECEAGSVVLDAVSFPKWRLDCNHCNYLVYLPPDLHSVRVSASTCEVCASPTPCRACNAVPLGNARCFAGRRRPGTRVRAGVIHGL